MSDSPYTWNVVQPPEPIAEREASSADELDGIFGLDISSYADLDATMRLRGGRSVLSEAIIRRITTPRGALFYAPDYGYDLRDLLNESFSPAALFQVQAALEAEIEKEDRVLSASVDLTIPATDKLRLYIRVEAAEGPFELVLTIDRLSIEVLSSDLE